MNDRDDKRPEKGRGIWLPLVLLPVLCCAGPLLIAGIGSFGVAAILAWIADPVVQAAAVAVLLVGLAALWRRRMHRRAAEAQTVPGTARVRTQSD